jgi:penicillin amidase
MLEAKEKLGIDDFKAMQSDWKSKTAEQMTKVFIESLKNQSGFNETEQAAFNKLKAWDYNLTRESQAASIFEILYRKSMENLVKDELSPELFEGMLGQKVLLENLMINLLAEGQSQWTDNVMTEQTESFDDIVALSFNETVEELTATLGNNVDDWNWGKIHSFTLAHPLGVVDILNKALKLNRGPFEVPGSFHTVCPYSYSYKNLYETVHGASHRHIFSMANWDDSETIIPTGTSGIPASNFYLDQTELYLNNDYHPDLFSKQNVQNKARFKMQLKPE